jgi:hypothetical protein
MKVKFSILQVFIKFQASQILNSNLKLMKKVLIKNCFKTFEKEIDERKA